MKLDMKMSGEIRKAKDNSIVPEDEYIVFLAHDTAFAHILPLYLEQCRQLGCDERQIKAVKELIERIDHWQRNHPDKCKIPDIAIDEKFLSV